MIGSICDAHMHLWDLANNYPWIDKTIFGGKMHKNFLIEDYLKISKNQPITKAVHIEAHGFPNDPVQETRWVQSISDKYGFPQGIVGYAPLHHPEIDTLLKRHREYPNFRGIRMNLRFASKGFFLADRGDYMRDKAWQHGFSLLSKYQLSFDMQIYPEQVPDAIQLLQTYKDAIVILDHLALPNDPTEATFKHWREHIDAIAEMPNVYMKISGIGVFFQGLEQRSVILKYIRHAINVFGVHRCLFASNCPPDAAYIPFDSIFEIFKEAVSDFPEDKQHLLFYENACKVYKV